MVSRSHSVYCQIFVIVPYSDIVEQEKNVKLVWRLPYLSNVSSSVKNQIHKNTVIKQRKWLSTHRQSELKKKNS